MSKEDFSAFLAALEKSSDRARSIIYVFTIVYIAIFVYAMSALLYPSRQIVFTDFLQRLELPAANPIQTELLHHQLTALWDDTLSLRSFQFPFFGIATDQQLVWIAFPILGILGYYIMWLALERVKSLFKYVADQNKSDTTRLRLILSTQLLTSPLSDHSSEFSKFHQRSWKSLGIVVFLSPIIVTIATILDHLNLIAPILGWGAYNLRFLPTLTFQLKLYLQLALLAFQACLFFKLTSVANSVGREQNCALRFIADAER